MRHSSLSEKEQQPWKLLYRTVLLFKAIVIFMIDVYIYFFTLILSSFLTFSFIFRVSLKNELVWPHIHSVYVFHAHIWDTLSGKMDLMHLIKYL